MSAVDFKDPPIVQKCDNCNEALENAFVTFIRTKNKVRSWMENKQCMGEIDSSQG